MFAASFDSKMGCLYSVFDVKKQGKPVWVVRARNWKLRGGENRLSGLLEGVSRGEGKEARGIEYNICSSMVFVFMTVHKGRIYQLKLVHDKDYPEKPPSVRFHSRVNMTCVNHETGVISEPTKKVEQKKLIQVCCFCVELVLFQYNNVCLFTNTIYLLGWVL
ncbi:hypothetical protein GQ457_13G012250 [Hibiscus cannabinus]